MDPKESYLIAACPRTGSWLLTYALQDFGTVGMPDEYFAQDIEAFWSDKWGVVPPAEGGSYRDYLDAAFRTGTSSNGRVRFEAPLGVGRQLHHPGAHHAGVRRGLRGR